MIYFPKKFGLCAGSKNAINIALSLKDKYEHVYIYKEILHNESVIKMLNSKGIFCIDNLDMVGSLDVLVIRAHGEGKNFYDLLNKRQINYVDATCPNVLKIHDIVSKKYASGFFIILVGKKNHAEVIGTNGWCDDNAFIIESLDDMCNFPEIKQKSIFVTAQTTIAEEFFREVVDNIKDRYSDKNIEVYDSICKAKMKILDSTISIAKKMDYVFVIGGRNSSNTMELCNKVSNVPKSYFVSSIDEFKSCLKDINFDSNICFTGGASTPYFEIEKYVNYFKFYSLYKSSIKFFNDNLLKINLSFIKKDDNKLITELIENFNNLNCDGKFIRAFLVDLGYKMGGKKDDYATKLALAYETFQTSILIHDDVIDNAKSRRGKKTITEVYKNKHDDYSLESIHDFNSLAICCGDLGLYYANKIIIDSYGNSNNFSNIFSYFNDIVINTIKGESLDVYLPFLERKKTGNCTLDDILEIYRLKTAWYTISGPFCLGMTLAGMDEGLISKMSDALIPLGIAFQIKDDILGIFSDSNVLGKDSTDIQEFKQTILYYFMVNDNEYRDSFLKCYGKSDISLESINEIRSIIKKAGVYDRSVNIMNDYFRDSIEKIKDIDMDEEIKNILLGLVTFLKYRNK